MNRLQSKPSISPLSSRPRRQKRFHAGMLISVGVTLAMILLAGGVLVVQQLAFSHAAAPSERHVRAVQQTTINGLRKITQVGSTATILNTRGKKATVDPNPYKIALTPSGTASIKANDILVSNIGNTDRGISIIKFTGGRGPGHLFNMAGNDGTLGPAGLVFNQTSGRLWVANSTGNSVLIFNHNGTLFTTIHNPLFNGPWGITTNNGWSGGKLSFFTANKFDGKLLRIDVIPQGRGLPKFNVAQIGQFDKNGDLTKIDLTWLPQLKIGGRTWTDVLLALDPVHNRVAAFAHSSMMKGNGKGLTVFQGKPLNMPGGLALNPLNGDLLVVNTADNNLVELNLTTAKVVGVKQIDPAKVDKQGNGSALFGVAAIKDEQGNLKVFFTDDNTNTLDVLSVS